MGVRRSLVVTIMAIRLQGPRFKPRPGQKFETRFMLHAHPCSGTTPSSNRASPKPGNWQKKRVSEWLTDGCRYISHKKKKHEWNSVAGEEDLMEKTSRYGRRRERRWTPTWVKAQDTRPSPNSQETHRGSEGTLDTNGRWAHGAMDGWVQN